MNDKKEYAKELTKPVNKKFQRRRVITYYNDDIWSADLADMSNLKEFNNNVTFLLCIIDIYSRYAYVIPLKNKSAITVLDAFKSIKKTPKNLWVDQGSEFLNKEFKKYREDNGINIYHTFSENKSAYAERFIRTLKELITKHILETNHNNYIDALPQIVQGYNETIHSRTKKTPDEVYHEEEEPAEYKEPKAIPIKLKVGDYVRITRVKTTFEKGYTPKWSKEVFKIYNVNTKQTPVMYSIEDQQGEKIDGKFYQNELQKTNLKDFAIISEVLKTRTLKGIKQSLVKYDGYSDKFNEWIDDSKLTKDK